MTNTNKPNKDNTPSEFSLLMENGLPSRVSAILLSDGREVYINQLIQYIKDYDVLVGVTTAEINKELIEDALTDAKDSIGGASKPLLIPPVMLEPKFTEKDRQKYLFAEDPQILPEVTCVASLDSNVPVKDVSADGAQLTIVWFQDQYAFPIAPHIIKHISELDWDNVATDYNF